MFIFGRVSKWFGKHKFKMHNKEYSYRCFFRIGFFVFHPVDFWEAVKISADFESYVVKQQAKIQHEVDLLNDKVILHEREMRKIAEDKAEKLRCENLNYYSALKNLQCACDDAVELFNDLEVFESK